MPDLMYQYHNTLKKFFSERRYDPQTQDISKARTLFERLPEHDHSYVDAFHLSIRNYLGEKMLEEMYFTLFKPFLWHKNVITKEEF